MTLGFMTSVSSSRLIIQRICLSEFTVTLAGESMADAALILLMDSRVRLTRRIVFAEVITDQSASSEYMPSTELGNSLKLFTEVGCFHQADKIHVLSKHFGKVDPKSAPERTFSINQLLSPPKQINDLSVSVFCDWCEVEGEDVLPRYAKFSDGIVCCSEQPGCFMQSQQLVSPFIHIDIVIVFVVV